MASVRWGFLRCAILVLGSVVISKGLAEEYPTYPGERLENYVAFLRNECDEKGPRLRCNKTRGWVASVYKERCSANPSCSSACKTLFEEIRRVGSPISGGVCATNR
jgi:hypothetical protein